MFSIVHLVEFLYIVELCPRNTRCSTLYKGDALQSTIYVCYPWEMALNVGLGVSFDDM
jgi:hypothetical protein